ncbi:MarR family transcriptional regulator [Candidatus Saccharibacteria bacterium]|nr:MarR family transcriptional regulator [Candidatus Saccharibacteria bacterium]
MLEELGVPRTRVRVMRFFAGNGEVEVGVRELARALKINAGNAQRELAKLVDLGYLVKNGQAYSNSKLLSDLCEKLEDL